VPAVPIQPNALRVLADAFDGAATSQPTKQAAARFITRVLLDQGFTIVRSNALVDICEAVTAASEEALAVRDFVSGKKVRA
jgi:hypothetical protein